MAGHEDDDWETVRGHQRSMMVSGTPKSGTKQSQSNHPEESIEVSQSNHLGAQQEGGNKFSNLNRQRQSVNRQIDISYKRIADK